MKSQISRRISLAAGLWLLAACSTAQGHQEMTATQAQTSQASGVMDTVKPGAAISLFHTKPGKMASGQFIPVALSIQEAYEGGEMQIEIEPSEGLSLFSGTSQKSFRMANADVHKLPLDVSAAQDGIYFLWITARALDQNKNITTQRRFSIRLDVGEITPEMKAKAFPENGTLSPDGKARILSAQETIR
jgi:hypothetical protein